MVPEAIPKSLLVVGSGAIGIEFASFYRDMGAEVTVVEVLDRILPVEDEEISRLRPQGLREAGHEDPHRRHGRRACRRAPTTSPPRSRPAARARTITVERVILAVGIVGNVEDIGLEGTEVKVEKTHIVIDEWWRTGEPGVYAIGDVVGPPWLAHKASHEGVICVEKIAGVKDVHPLNVREHPGLHLLPAAGRQRRPDRGGGEGQAGYEVKVGQLPVHRQRQGDRARRARRHGQDGVRRQDRRACWART